MKKRILLIYATLLVLVLALDLYTKSFIQHAMKQGESHVLIKNFFSITYVKNTGAAWGIFSGHTEIFYPITLIAAIAIIYYFVKSKSALSRLGLTLVFAGLLGNLFDRVTLFYVRDFLDFIIFGYDFPVFNVADMGVVIGMGCLLLEIIIEEFKLWKYKQSKQV